MRRIFPISTLVLCVACNSASSQQSQHFDAKGKQPSEFTRLANKQARDELPFDDTRDFEEQQRGFIAAPDSLKIEADAGHTAWDLERYSFLEEQTEFDSIHPSLHRQSRLNMNYGLYEVTPNIYQVRGFDLANVTFVKGDTGWIVFDPLTIRETARAAKALVDQHLGERPVVAVVYSHSHGDHFGGVMGVVNSENLLAGKVQVIAPRDFMHHAVSENIHAGNAMSRRLTYQYGTLTPASPFGHAGQGLGQNIAAGSPDLVPPTHVVEKDFEEITIDGVRMVFQNTPNTEAPAEMNTYFPDWKALWMAENVTGTMHNIYTLRGALVRDALAWSKSINEALYLYGQKAEVMFASHHWPRWGNDRIQQVLRDQRDMYAHLNNFVLHLANSGTTINEIHNEYELPESLQQKWHARGYHGSPQHNSRAVINRYLGYWDTNPATLIPVSPSDSAPLYVEMMGGASKILDRAESLTAEGKYLLAVELLNKLVYAEPDNENARDALADAFEQIGYQQENPGLRNSFLTAAYELRSGIPEGESASSASIEIIRALPAEQFFEFLAILVDSRKAVDLDFAINVHLTDIDERFVVELSNATLSAIKGYEIEGADLDISVAQGQVADVFLGATPLDELLELGAVELEGNADPLQSLMGTLAFPDPRFEIMPGTAAD